MPTHKSVKIIRLRDDKITPCQRTRDARAERETPPDSTNAGLDVRPPPPPPAVMYGFRNATVKDAELKVLRGADELYDFLKRFAEIVPS